MEDFRGEVRDWLDEHLPASMRTGLPEEEFPWGGRNPSYPNPDSKTWLEAMVAKGWTAPTWPIQYGGAGLDPAQALILQEELNRSKARPPLFSFGLWMLGPVLMEYGTDEQKNRFLRSIANGETRWCQGYSEPGAGSDLASLRTRAEDKGDHWLVNGQKIWTSYADKADWMFCLVRTDPAVPKHLGISFLLIDLATPGVSVEPIELISGSSPFCETFLTDVKVPKENMVGPLNGGWAIAKKLLQYERQNVSAIGFGGDRSVRLEEIAKSVCGDDDGAIDDGAMRNRIARYDLYSDAVDATTRRSQLETDSGSVGALTSVVKYASAKCNQLRGELAVEVLGLDGLGWSGSEFAPGDLNETRQWLRSKGNSIEGGTSEINLNVIAKRVLGLPD